MTATETGLLEAHLHHGDRRAADRSAGLDALRAAAALLVAVFHLRTVLVFDFGPLNRIVEGGDAGVFIFFALSGYLLYRPFVRGDVDLRSYALKRAARILPGYFVALAALTFLTGNPLPIEHPLPYLTMTASYSVPLRAFLGNAWTLSAEVIFYVLLPGIAWLVRGHEIRRLTTLAAASAAATLVYLLVNSATVDFLVGSFPLVAYCFVPGMILAVVELRHPRVFVALGSPVALVVGLLLIGVETQTRGFPIALAAGIGTPLVMGWLLLHHTPGARLLAFLGGASYAMYLWHKDLYIAFGPVGFVIAAVGAALSWAVVERPILNWAHRRAQVWRRATLHRAAQLAAVQPPETPTDLPAAARP